MALADHTSYRALRTVVSIGVEVSFFWQKRVYRWWTRKPPKKVLVETIHDANVFEEWEAAAFQLDELNGNDLWRQNAPSKYYDYRLIYTRLQSIIDALEDSDILGLVNLLRSGLVRNLGNITAPRLYNRAYAGTKLLIEDYITQVALAIDHVAIYPTNPGVHNDAGLTSQAKLDLLHDTRQAFGRSALVLQGGAIFGLCHIGVVKALHLRGLLPRIIVGTSTGALIAALVGVHGEDELLEFLTSDRIDLSAFGARKTRKTVGGGDDASQVESTGWSATLIRRVKRFIREGYLLDVSMLEECVRANVGDLTFEEAYAKTKRVLNIIVPTDMGGGVPSLLNYLTAPNVLIWSAAVASNASSSPLYAPITLLCKSPSGAISPWSSTHTSACPPTRTWTITSRTPSPNDPRSSPLSRTAELFNVNHFLVSQARPYVAPFLQSGDTHSHNTSKHPRQASTITSFVSLPLLRVLALEMQHRLRQLDALGLLHTSVRRFLVDEIVPGPSLTLVPELSARDFWALITFERPTKRGVEEWILRGEKSVWPAVGALRVRCAVEVELDRAYQVVRRRKPLDALEMEGAREVERGMLKGSGEKRRKGKQGVVHEAEVAR